jgi:hypothetical protein
MGVCMCTTGPPPGGRCSACGAVGPTIYDTPSPPPPTPRVGRVEVAQLTEEDIRRIFREELAQLGIRPGRAVPSPDPETAGPGDP